MRKLFTFRWISFHLLVIGCTVLFAFLGKWQWAVGGEKRGTLRNFAYGMEWWIFGIILVVCWIRLLHQELSGVTAQQAKAAANRAKAPRYRVPAPQVTPEVDEDEDPEMAEYNRYLIALHMKDMSASFGPKALEAGPSARKAPVSEAAQ